MPNLPVVEDAFREVLDAIGCRPKLNREAG
jgi:hypothetical protein